MAWNGQDSNAAIGKGSVSRNKDSSGTHVCGVLSGIARHLVACSGKICVPDFKISWVAVLRVFPMFCH
jgi:hypothetical protein